MAVSVVNEKSQCLISIDFEDEDGVAVTPTKVTYRIDDIESGTNIVASTDLTPSSSTLEITVTSAQNAMISQFKATEDRLVTITWEYGGVVYGTEDYTYRVKNLGKIA